MINQTSSIAAAALDQIVSLNKKLNEASIINNIFNTEITQKVMFELNRQELNARQSYWAICRKTGIQPQI